MRRLATHARHNVIGYVALFIALGGVSYAAVGRDSVGTLQVRDGSLVARDFKGFELPAGPRGARGPAGPRGARLPYTYAAAVERRSETTIAGTCTQIAPQLSYWIHTACSASGRVVARCEPGEVAVHGQKDTSANSSTRLSDFELHAPDGVPVGWSARADLFGESSFRRTSPNGPEGGQSEYKKDYTIDLFVLCIPDPNPPAGTGSLTVGTGRDGSLRGSVRRAFGPGPVAITRTCTYRGSGASRFAFARVRQEERRRTAAFVSISGGPWTLVRKDGAIASSVPAGRRAAVLERARAMAVLCR